MAHPCVASLSLLLAGSLCQDRLSKMGERRPAMTVIQVCAWTLLIEE